MTFGFTSVQNHPVPNPTPGLPSSKTTTKTWEPTQPYSLHCQSNPNTFFAGWSIHRETVFWFCTLDAGARGATWEFAQTQLSAGETTPLSGIITGDFYTWPPLVPWCCANTHSFFRLVDFPVQTEKVSSRKETHEAGYDWYLDKSKGCESPAESSFDT